MTSFEILLTVLWLAIFIVNKAALLPLFILCVNVLSLNLLDSGFAVYIITSIAYYQLSTVNITISSEVRHAFLAFGSIYLLSAVDELLYYQLDVSTVYYDYMPYFVVGLNAYIAALLLVNGRRDNAGIISAVGRCWHRLRYGI
jgi:hypothetical protein